MTDKGQSVARVAQVGCGYWGKNLTRNFAEIGVLSAIVEGNATVAESFSAQYGVPAMSFEDVLQDNGLNAVSIATPAETHAQLALRALDAGKHVYIEKPIALAIEDAEKLIRKAEEVDRRLMVGHLLQYHPIYTKLRELVRQGKVGDLHYVYSNRLSLGKFRKEENVLWSFAPHDVSMILGIVGEEPTEVSARGGSFFTPGIADWCVSSLAFPSGVRGHVSVSWMHPFKEQRLVVSGSAGALVFEDSKESWSDKLAYYPQSFDVQDGVPVPTKGAFELIAVEPGEPLRAECEHFVDCIEKGQRPRTDGREGLAVLQVLSRLDESMSKSL